MQAPLIEERNLYNECVDSKMEHYFLVKCKNEKPELVKRKVTELLKYLSMAHHESGYSIPVSNEIDDMWHLWILQTKQYQELMEKLPSKKFIHHSSNDYPEEMLDANYEIFIAHQISYLASYLINFGPFTMENVIYWPMANQLLEHLGSLNALNEYLYTLMQESKIA